MTAELTATPAPEASFGTQFGAVLMRHLRLLGRQPAYLSISLMQAVIWLPLFGSLFRHVADVPGFDGGRSYLGYLTPGVVAMTALFTSGWAGMGFIQDMEGGVMDRLLTSPARRGALVAGPIAYQAVMITIQTVIIVVLGWALGTHFRSGPAGALVLLVAAVLLAAFISGLSITLALLVRNEESLIAASQFIVLPLTFLSSAMMPRDLLPGWIATVARYNPVDWAITAGREALGADPDWTAAGWRLGALAALAVATGALAARAFRTYQRSL
ncbi:ABC transporter permease [Frankia sp. AgB32]|uniref:ABC transporter permease n=1 Tax=Frankia sp. AgB32 TaxID=631119 RepID=UPI00200FC6C4|nr:ABC transporter permease [Frankia sp. AgB32]MCK9894262.1 ABC transporter permease [Frankia sp. AgB32]